MAIDFSNLSSIQAYLTQYKTGATASSTNNFTDYFMQAIDQSKTNNHKNDANSMYNLFASNSNSVAMQGLLGLGNSNISSQYIQGTTTGYPLLNNENNSTTELFSNYLQSSFQAKISNAMISAKSKLQANLDAYKAEHTGSENELIKSRLHQMEQNVSLLDKYLTPGNTSNETSSTNDQLMQHLNKNAAYT
ncbi:MAG: hypothetical protein ABS882_12465, partial [Lysinibacillus sp.]